MVQNDLQSAQCSKDNQGNKFYNKPDNFDTGDDYITFAIVVAQGASGYSSRCYSQGVQVDAERGLNPSLNHGICEDMAAGHQKLVVIKNEAVVYSAISVGFVSSGCPLDMYNMNYQVVAITPGDKTASC